MIKDKKEVVKKRFKLTGILVILLLLYIFGFFFYKILLIPIKNIYVINNKYLTDQQIIDESGLKNYPSFFLTTKGSIKNKLLKNSMIKSIEIKKVLFGKVHLIVTENEPLFYNSITKKTILDSKEEVSNNNYIVPVLINSVNYKVYVELIEKMGKIDNNILLMISQIKYEPTKIDKQRFLFMMNDGNYVYITLTKIKSINEYISILPTLNNQKGILYLDSGNYFEIFN